MEQIGHPAQVFDLMAIIKDETKKHIFDLSVEKPDKALVHYEYGILENALSTFPFCLRVESYCEGNILRSSIREVMFFDDKKEMNEHINSTSAKEGAFEIRE